MLLFKATENLLYISYFHVSVDSLFIHHFHLFQINLSFVQFSIVMPCRDFCLYS